MRRALAIAALLTLAAGSAAAEAWTPFAGDPAALQWFYDADYSYRDQQSGKVVVMQAVSKPSAKIGPSGPGKPDGVGSIVALDCARKTVVLVSSYKPGVVPAEADGWRGEKGKAATSADDKALIGAVCPGAAGLPTK
ncbi:MAG: hypothetical protein ACK4YQ_05565 [Phenylobacterium sp.]|uniref:hypothetical protein n=1 Tax=Phenylobacterium sp. TaxID=1871053 RepID=UPI00391BBA36